MERVAATLIALVTAYLAAFALLVLGIGHLAVGACVAAAILGLFALKFLAMAIYFARVKPQPVRVYKRTR